MTEAMEDFCSVALSWGMSWDQFWFGDMDIVLSYRKKRKLEQEEQQILMDTNAWLIGVYVQKAVNSVLVKEVSYPKIPYYQAKLEEQNKTEEELATEKFLQLDSWKRTINKNMKSEKER
jgi:hypothetical protein